MMDSLFTKPVRGGVFCILSSKVQAFSVSFGTAMDWILFRGLPNDWSTWARIQQKSSTNSDMESDNLLPDNQSASPNSRSSFRTLQFKIAFARTFKFKKSDTPPRTRGGVRKFSMILSSSFQRAAFVPKAAPCRLLLHRGDQDA